MDASPEDRAICARVRSNRRQWWEKTPGYVALEVEAERDKPARLKLPAEINWATYRLASRANCVVVYDDRSLYFDSLRALHREWA